CIFSPPMTEPTMPTKPMNPAASHERAHGEESVEEPERNPGVPLDLDWIDAVQADPAVVERRVAELSARRAPSDRKRTEELLRAVTLLDLPTLSGDDTPETVRRLCDRARRPLRAELLAQLGAGQPEPHVAAVCVYHAFVETAVEALRGTGIPVAAVSAGFPAGLNPFELRVREIEESVRAGAREIDIVITRAHVLTGNWRALYDEVRAFREACGDAHLKTILATGELGTLRNVARASLVCMMGGSDFVKTSTGKESVNATLPVSLVMVRTIREYLEHTGHRVGFKPAGGIRSA